MADVVEDSETHTNRRSEGLFFATRNFAGKFVSASGIIFAGVIVSAVGFDSITNVADFTNEHRFTQAVFFLPIYCTVCLSAVACILMYRIDRESHEANLQIIKERMTPRPKMTRQRRPQPINPSQTSSPDRSTA